MKLAYYQVNTFTEQFDGGNPAGVMPLDDWLDDSLMQAIARENGLSETAFFVAGENAFELRWFTPGCEVDLCGHATLASAFVLATEKKLTQNRYLFTTRSGELAVTETEGRLTLDMPVSNLRPAACPDCIAQGLGLAPAETYLADDYLVVLEDESTVRELAPDFSKMQQVDARGTIVTAPSTTDGIDFVSRWFGGPDVAIDEDPVTGSAHGALARYWSQRLNKPSLEALQLSERQGRLTCHYDGGDRVQVAGKAVLYCKGYIYV